MKNRVSNITNAKTFYNSVKALEKQAENEQGICIHKRRTLLFVSSDEIRHERRERDCMTVPGTRKLHSVLGVERGIIKTRRLSCFCAECLQRHYDQCLNTQYVDAWKLVKLKPSLPEMHQAVDVPEAIPVADVQTADMPEVLPAADMPEVHVLPAADMPEMLPAPDVPAADVHQAAVHVPETSDDSDVHHPLLGESDAVDLDLSFSDLSLGDVSLTTLLESLDTESKDFFQTLRSSSSTRRRLLCMGILFTVGLSRKTSHKNMLTVFLRNSLVLY